MAEFLQGFDPKAVAVTVTAASVVRWLGIWDASTPEFLAVTVIAVLAYGGRPSYGYHRGFAVRREVE